MCIPAWQVIASTECLFCFAPLVSFSNEYSSFVSRISVATCSYKDHSC